MEGKLAEKIEYWQGMHRQAGIMLEGVMGSPTMIAYYNHDDHSYIVLWQLRQRFCYRQIKRHRGF